MKISEFIQFLSKLPPDMVFCEGAYTGEHPIEPSDFKVVIDQGEPLLVIPDYEWSHADTMTIDEFLARSEQS